MIFFTFFQLLEVCCSPYVGSLPISCLCGASQNPHCHVDYYVQKNLWWFGQTLEVSFFFDTLFYYFHIIFKCRFSKYVHVNSSEMGNCWFRTLKFEIGIVGTYLLNAHYIELKVWREFIQCIDVRKIKLMKYDQTFNRKTWSTKWYQEELCRFLCLPN